MMENALRMVVKEFEQNESGIASSEMSVVTRAISIQTEKCTQISLNSHFFLYIGGVRFASNRMSELMGEQAIASACTLVLASTFVRSFVCLFNSFDKFFLLYCL